MPRQGPREACGSVRSAAVQEMADSDEGYANQRPDGFGGAVRHEQRASHDNEAERTDQRGPQLAMLAKAAAKRDDSQCNCEQQTDNMNHRADQYAPSRKEGEEQRRGDAMQNAKPAQPDRDAIEAWFNRVPHSGSRRC